VRQLKKVNKYYHIFKISLANHLVYVLNFLSKNIFFVFIIFIFLMLWKSIYGQKGELIGGFTLNQMIWYLIITETITLSRSNVFNEVSEDVKKGNIAYLLNKPYNYIFYNFSNSLGEIMIKLISNLGIGVIIGILYVGPLKQFNILHIPLIMISILLGVFINFFVYIILALSSFWIEENTAFMWIYSKLVFTLGGMLIPLEMFPYGLKQIAKYLPFAYVTYAPAKLVVDFSLMNYLYTILFQIIYLSTFIAISIFVYRKGVRVLNVNGG